MNLKFHSPILITNKLNQLKDFYINVLGQSIELDFSNCIILECGLSLWQLAEDHKIAKHLGRTYSPEGNNNLELSFETDDFDKVISELKKHSPKLLHDVTEETWGQKTIRFYDPENNLIEVGETIPCFIKRMHSEGMSVDEIVKKSSVSKEMVEEMVKSD